MKAENALQFMMDFWGDRFWNRQKCLDYLFCTVGTGYEWRDGELFHKDYDMRLERWNLCRDIEHAEPCRMVEAAAEAREGVLRSLAKMRGRNPDEDKWYPISKEYSYICNYPENIKPDWLKLINECKQMLKADGIEVPENNR